jgi:hypothetical protein
MARRSNFRSLLPVGNSLPENDSDQGVCAPPSETQGTTKKGMPMITASAIARQQAGQPR